MSNKTYTLEQIKKAFWAEFHESGELFFNYLGTTEENENSTKGIFQSFLERLDPNESC